MLHTMRYDMNGRSLLQGGKNWILPKEINANRFFWDSHWLEIWSNHFCPSYGTDWRELGNGLRDWRVITVLDVLPSLPSIELNKRDVVSSENLSYCFFLLFFLSNSWEILGVLPASNWHKHIEPNTDILRYFYRMTSLCLSLYLRQGSHPLLLIVNLSTPHRIFTFYPVL